MYEEIFNQIRSAANKRNLKDSTIHAYCTSVAHFLNRTAKDIDALTTDDVDIFLTEKKLSGISPETYNHYHSGIRFFYKKILKKNWDDDDIPRMKRDRKLPTVLTKAEISAILDATPNLKHKAMIATMYSGGFVFQKSHIFIMMIFHARTKPYTSVMGKVALIVILCLQTGRSKY